jgi:hypothetical protein
MKITLFAYLLFITTCELANYLKQAEVVFNKEVIDGFEGRGRCYIHLEKELFNLKFLQFNQ